MAKGPLTLCAKPERHETQTPTWRCEGAVLRLLLQLFQSLPFTDGKSGVSNKFRDQRVFSCRGAPCYLGVDKAHR